METTYVLLALLAVVVILFVLSIQKVNQSKLRIVERLGKYNQRPLRAGIHFIIPFLESVREEFDISEKLTNISASKVITSDNVLIAINAVLIWRIIDGAKFLYRVENGEVALINTIQSAIRAACGNRSLDQINSERIRLAKEIADQTAVKAEEWGVVVGALEIIEVTVEGKKDQESMELQLTAERERRALILTAEGTSQQTRLAAEANLYQTQKEAEGIKIDADAKAYAIRAVAEATAFKFITEGNAIQGNGAAILEADVRQAQIKAFEKITMGKASKLVIVPGELTQAAAEIAKALKVKL